MPNTTIVSVLELFPEGETVLGISEAEARDANAQVKQTLGAGAADLFEGPQRGLCVLDVLGVAPSVALEEQRKTRDVLLWPAASREVLEAALVTPKKKSGLRVGLLQLRADVDFRRQFRKAGGMDLDVLIVGVLPQIPTADHALYGLLHTYAEVGVAVVGILDPSLPAQRLPWEEYKRLVGRPPATK